MRKLAITILFLITSSSFAKHKDQVFFNKYGNVKTLVKTGFDNYGATTRVEILGKLAQKLCLKLSYKDTIVIEFRHDYTNFYSKMVMVEHGNPNSEYLICHDIENIGEEQKKSHLQANGNSAICIREIDTDFDILKTLKIIEYCILHKFENSNISFHCKSSLYFDTSEMIDIQYLGMPNDTINEIIHSKETKILKETLNEAIPFYTFLDVKGFYKDQIYYFETEKVKYKTKTLSYIVSLENGVLIFPNNKSFVYLNKKLTEIKTHHAHIRGSYAYLVRRSDPYFPDKPIGDNNILLWKLNVPERIVFSEINNKVVEVRKP